ncbi:MAG: Lrp/AsnC family transcriptional regulator [Gammaproteobacteria bacterium]|nr:Lrp/AsnC family transcriptional regulator [Gammaproteobacteria bacterium]MBT4494484.1 Lrp/AsnC family transcriptional regulator [Gammaproteobacteria bacterium]MBT7371857.1 Lrp/AsnC family transcriptional regulator [Gammaproteobacteria bacterium]
MTSDALALLDREVILATQAGLPLVPEPYQQIADQLKVNVSLLKQRLTLMRDDGRIRRIGAVPNHYKLGYTANGMSVWDVPDDRIQMLGDAVGDLGFVSHCYHRPRFLPDWSYNLFAMVHGRDRDEVFEKAKIIKELLGDDCRAHDILFSSRILKKTGIRIGG